MLQMNESPMDEWSRQMNVTPSNETKVYGCCQNQLNEF